MQSMTELLDLLRAVNRLRGRPSTEGEWLRGVETALAAAFACDRRLAVYGTLAPGERNHHILAPVAGNWQSCTVPGRLSMRENPVFSWYHTAPPVRMQLFTGLDLPAHWARIDGFEGSDYSRILVPVFADGQLLTVANLYAPVDPVVDQE
jgi:gamma-glutamylcyclotransferase (GGCT)/AIG2-like uncharacterized protein YtfP